MRLHFPLLVWLLPVSAAWPCPYLCNPHIYNASVKLWGLQIWEDLHILWHTLYYNLLPNFNTIITMHWVLDLIRENFLQISETWLSVGDFHRFFLIYIPVIFLLTLFRPCVSLYVSLNCSLECKMFCGTLEDPSWSLASVLNFEKQNKTVLLIITSRCHFLGNQVSAQLKTK